MFLEEISLSVTSFQVKSVVMENVFCNHASQVLRKGAFYELANMSLWQKLEYVTVKGKTILLTGHEGP
jgi:hypothetical protein